METWEAITSRRNVRSFTDRPIPAGRPLVPIRHPTRRSFDDVVHRGRW